MDNSALLPVLAKFSLSSRQEAEIATLATRGIHHVHTVATALSS
jgi:hypothetical protein